MVIPIIIIIIMVLMDPRAPRISRISTPRLYGRRQKMTNNLPTACFRKIYEYNCFDIAYDSCVINVLICEKYKLHLSTPQLPLASIIYLSETCPTVLNKRSTRFVFRQSIIFLTRKFKIGKIFGGGGR